MRSTNNVSKSFGIKLLAVAVLVLTAAGCQMGSYLPGSGMVDREYWIPLQDGKTQSNTWDGMYVTIKYKYARDGGRLVLQGGVRYADKMVYNYIRVQYFHLDVLLLDPEGKVIETQGLASSSDDSLVPMGLEPVVDFDKEIMLPPNAVAMAFSYKGQAVASGDAFAGGGRYFWEFPVH